MRHIKTLWMLKEKTSFLIFGKGNGNEALISVFCGETDEEVYRCFAVKGQSETANAVFYRGKPQHREWIEKHILDPVRFVFGIKTSSSLMWNKHIEEHGFLMPKSILDFKNGVPCLRADFL